MTALLQVKSVAKTFTMHLRGGVVLPVVDSVNFEVNAGECVVLGGPSNTEPPRRYRCDDELRTAPDAGATAGTKVP